MNTYSGALEKTFDYDWGNPVSLMSICYILWGPSEKSYPLWEFIIYDCKWSWKHSYSELLTLFLMQLNQEDIDALIEEYRP